jgi:Zn-dependent peptidase ImmA (M78 family)
LDLQDFAGGSASAVAATLRERLGYREDQPIPSVVDVVERFGVDIIEMVVSADIDGFAAYLDGKPVIALNADVPADRARLDAAHELGHLLLGHCAARSFSGFSDVAENDAYAFASHFLMPPATLRQAFIGKSVARLVEFKERFGISMAAMVYRAGPSGEGLLSKKETDWLWRQFSIRGWRRKGGEPGHVRPDRAVRFEVLVDYLLAQNNNNWQRVASLLHVDSERLRRRWGELMGADVLLPQSQNDGQFMRLAD